MSLKTHLILASAVVLLAVAALAGLVPKFLVVAAPNEWLLHIADGKLQRAGVGITCVLGPFDSAVKFPADIHKVNFSAQQVSIEMQGIEVEGFIVWTVYRDGDGPLKAYKYLNGLTPAGLRKANLHVGGMTESIIRHQVANMPLNQVIQGRDLLRDKVRSEMMSVLQGWGMWLETVEVTDVRILSQRVFDDLQSEYRLGLHARAEGLRLNTTRSIEEQRLVHDTHLDTQRREAKSLQELAKMHAALEYERELASVEAARHALALAKVARTKELRLQEVEAEAEVAGARAAAEIKLAEERAASERDILRARLEVEATMSTVSLQKHALDVTQEVFARLPLKEVKLYNSGGADQPLSGLIPGLAHILKDINDGK